MDSETQHYARLIQIKQAQLRILDEKAARYGLDTPPHVEMERVTLREEIGMFEKAIGSPARAKVTDELGPAGRYLVNYEQNRELAAEFDRFSQLIMKWIAALSVAALFTLIVVVILATYLVTRGGS